MKRGEEGKGGREREETRDTERNESVGGEAAAEREGLEARVETTKSGEAAPVNVAYYKAPSATIPPVAPPVALPSSTNRPRSSIHATIAPASSSIEGENGAAPYRDPSRYPVNSGKRLGAVVSGNGF